MPEPSSFIIHTSSLCDTSAIDRDLLEVLPFDAFLMVGFRQESHIPPIARGTVFSASMHPEPFAMTLAAFCTQHREYVLPLLEKLKVSGLVEYFKIKEES